MSHSNKDNVNAAGRLCHREAASFFVLRLRNTLCPTSFRSPQPRAFLRRAAVPKTAKARHSKRSHGAGLEIDLDNRPEYQADGIRRAGGRPGDGTLASDACVASMLSRRSKDSSGRIREKPASEEHCLRSQSSRQ
jgi:hypothetical protein